MAADACGTHFDFVFLSTSEESDEDDDKFDARFLSSSEDNDIDCIKQQDISAMFLPSTPEASDVEPIKEHSELILSDVQCKRTCCSK